MVKVGREAAQAKNELVREHGWSPNILVFGREPRAFGEVHSQGNPVAYHPNVGTKGTNISNRVKYRFHARLAFLRSQVKDMLGRTLEQRTRKLSQPEQGQLVFFWREARHRRKQNPVSNWVGPGFVVGVQGTNAWVSCAGRCFLVAGEHIRLAVGDEVEYGAPEAQQALALFRKPLKEQTFEDLTNQKGPPKDNQHPVDVDEDFLGDLLDSDDDVVQSVGNKDKGTDKSRELGPPFVKNVPREVKAASRKPGWSNDQYGNPMFVKRHAVNFILPARLDGSVLPKYRTT